jgi:hypothetical protein
MVEIRRPLLYGRFRTIPFSLRAIQQQAAAVRGKISRTTSSSQRARPAFVQRNTAVTGVPLDPNGNFRIDDVLNPAPTECASSVLLIRNTTGVWFAAGIPALEDD